MIAPKSSCLELSLAVQRERSDEEEEVAPLSALLHEQGLFTAGMLNPFIFTYGERYLISAFQEEVLSLPPPYETMCSQYDSKSGEYSYADGVVQSEECSSKCIADNWQQHCSCFSKLYSVKHRRHGPICEYIDHRSSQEVLGFGGVSAILMSRTFTSASELRSAVSHCSRDLVSKDD
nr:uncharacterized protein LOC129386104 [Dermacentor andersoni]